VRVGWLDVYLQEKEKEPTHVHEDDTNEREKERARARDVVVTLVLKGEFVVVVDVYDHNHHHNLVCWGVYGYHKYTHTDHHRTHTHICDLHVLAEPSEALSVSLFLQHGAHEELSGTGTSEAGEWNDSLQDDKRWQQQQR